ncbi:MAG: hypothetical protein WCR42_00590 [bacterium]
MFLKRMTLMLAMMLTMFAVSAKAINCSTPPLECFGSTGSGSSSVSVSFTGPGGTIICNYDYCYCYTCPDPILDPPGTPIKLYIWDIESTNGCTEIDMDLVYAAIREGLTSPTMLENLCGSVPPCGAGQYKYFEYRVMACWYSLYIGPYLHFLPCPGCTAQCVTLSRVCKTPDGYYNVQELSMTLVGDLECSTCALYGFGVGDSIPPMARLDTTLIPPAYVPGECYHVCH